ncbi:hypothetical protein T484DRAFT_1845199 [Baffinella frigidus]|nr:hypothetical protein T484DRAFT_1845199 [Cryptophyta sp. CCMP2293]
MPKARPAPKAIKRSAELLYEVEKVLDARMGKFGPEYLVKWKGHAASKNQWISLPPFFKRRCLLLLHRAKWGDSWASSSDDSGTDEDDYSDKDSDEDSDEDSDSGSDSSSDSDEDECYCYCKA